jgi:UDP-N-acetylglucosamine 2-epimerase (non-hydrolysing)
MKLMVVFGTRPEVIKLAPVILAGAQRPGLEVVACSTGQHRYMLDQALQCFDLHPQIDLGLMQANQTLPDLTARLVQHITQTLQSQQPDVVMVQGDTTTAFAAALSAFYQRIPVAHIEAGLRTGDLHSPFPEEANRSLIARLAHWHFTPTPAATHNLLREGIAPKAIVQCGNTVIDAVEHIKRRWLSRPYQGQATAWFAGQDLVLVTTHRRENFGQGLDNICHAVETLCQQYPSLGFVFPVHLNPSVQAVVRPRLGHLPNLLLTEPVDFESSLYLQGRSVLVMSDSGGIQEEAPSFGVPCVVMREHTERREGIDSGFATLCGIDSARIVQVAQYWLNDPSHRQALQVRPNPYGDGQASQTILGKLT